MKKTFINLQTNKEWWIETEGLNLKTCLNNGKIKEISCDGAYQLKSKSASAMMQQMKKGFIYHNPDAGFGEVLYHRYINRDYNGFMPVATSLNSDDFYVTRLVGQFEDEILYHFGGNHELLNQYHLGEKRMTYRHVLTADGKLLFDNSYLIECFDPETQMIKPFAGYRDSMITMLDTQGNMTLWYTGTEIIVYDFKTNNEVFREQVSCEKTGEPFAQYYCKGLLSPKGTKLLYRVTKDGYTVVDLLSGNKIFIHNENWHPFFSPDDKCICISSQYYNADNGSVIDNPFPFEVPGNLTYYDTCNAISRGKIMAVRYDRGGSPIQIWDYDNKKRLASIEDDFIVRNASYAFTRNMLVVHTDYGTISVYNC